MSDLTAILARLSALEADVLACQTETEPTPPLACVAVLDGPQTSATLTFNVPASPGGTPITGYEAVSTPGGFSASGSAPPLVVAGLDGANAEYTFEVRAVNAVGHSLPCVTAAVGTNPVQTQLAVCQDLLDTPFIVGVANVFSTDRFQVWRSANGTVWAPLMDQFATFGTTGGARGIAYNGVDQWMIAANFGSSLPRVLYSADGSTWTVASSPSLDAGLSATCVAYGLDKWVVCTLGLMNYSFDGITWATASSGGTAVAHNGTDLWVAAAAPLRTSSDGITWTSDVAVAGLTATSCVAYSAVDDVWVVGSTDSAVARSTDAGVTWTVGAIALRVNVIAHNGIDLWVAGGGLNGTGKGVNYSADAITWTAVSGPLATMSVQSVVYAAPTGATGALWIVSGSPLPGANEKVYTSSDGITWSPVINSTSLMTPNHLVLAVKKALPL
jgi:hypothetical protein